MLKKLVLFLVLAAFALVAYNYVTTGRLALVPTASLSEEEQAINEMADQVRALVKNAAAAGRAAGLSGIDTTQEIEAARIQLQAIQTKAKELGKQASEKTREQLSRLQAELDRAKKDLGVR